MEGIIIIIILYFIIRFVYRLFKGVTKPARQTREQTEATKPRPVERRADFRFPSVKPKAPPKPVFQESGEPGVIMREYTPIQPSIDLESQFSEYKGSLATSSTEGAGYETEAYEPSAEAYNATSDSRVQILPERFSRDTLLQAVVMSEVLKRPRSAR